MINMATIKDLPAIPDLFYRTEWKGWDTFLNTMYPYDWELIEIINFNYNGLGDAIALCDGRTTFMHLVDLNAVLFGSQHGHVHYDVIATDRDRVVLRRSKQSKESPVTNQNIVTKKKVKAKSKKSSKNVRKKKV
jgi:hypothetical protein